MLLQLIEHSDLVCRLSDGACESFVAAFRTLRNFAVRMHESIQRDRVSLRCRGAWPQGIQIRFADSS